MPLRSFSNTVAVVVPPDSPAIVPKSSGLASNLGITTTVTVAVLQSAGLALAQIR